MLSFVVDTHPIVWHLTGDMRLGPQGRALFQGADNGDIRLIVPGIVLIEIIYLVEKHRLPANLVSQVVALLEPPTINYHLAPLDLPVIKRLEAVDRSVVPDLPDRIVVATALRWDLPLISRDAAFSRVAELNLVW